MAARLLLLLLLLLQWGPLAGQVRLQTFASSIFIALACTSHTHARTHARTRTPFHCYNRPFALLLRQRLAAAVVVVVNQKSAEL